MTAARVRRLGADDVPAMRAANALFAAVFDDADSYAAAPPSDRWLAERLADRGSVALVAEADGAVIGALAGYELRKFERERSEFYIYDLAVEAGHRRRGVATALIAALRRIAAEAGGWTVFVQADPGDLPAIALYTRLGVREDVLHFDIPPGEAGTIDV